MQAQPFRLVRQELGALPIFDQTIQRIELLEHLTEAMGQARYAEAILLLLKNIRVFSASLRCRGYLDYFLGALPRRRAGKSIWLTLSIEKAIGSKS